MRNFSSLKKVLLIALFFSLFIPAYSQDTNGKDRDEHDATTVSAIEKVKKSVVAIYAVIQGFESGKESKSKSGGSGFIIDHEGHVVTNYHVAANATKFKVKLWDQQEIGATLIGSDSWTDVALLQLNMDEIKGTSLTWASLGDSDKVVQGESVVAIGMPAGLERTVTKGIISSQAHDRTFRPLILPDGQLNGKYYSPIQTDAALYGGNSGGPLCNLKGEIIGLNNSGIAHVAGFAIPINDVKDAVSKILKTGEVARSYAGVEFQPLNDFESLIDINKGIVISHVYKSSPADEAGIKTGDVLLKVADKEVKGDTSSNIPAVHKLIGNLEVNGEYQFTLWRDGKEFSTNVKTTKLQPYTGISFEVSEWGCIVRGMTLHMSLKRNLKSVLGVIVGSLTDTSPAKKSGLEFGDIITKVNEKEIDNLENFKEIYKNWLGKKEKILLTVLRGKAVKLVILDSSK
ncbi:MAG: trypsin-like peptidase domain-containing protein [Planctomycetes bacterium]|nr:trypsin-like peptidase domain-containing protein [Planctomycetota bacterium]